MFAKIVVAVFVLTAVAANSKKGYRSKYEDHIKHHRDNNAQPKCKSAKAVKDSYTHEIKQKHENRDNDAVKGENSLHQPSGIIRSAKYYADKKNGFNPDVKEKGYLRHTVPEHY